MQSSDFVIGKIETNLNQRRIEYTRPSITRRIFANLVDVIIFVFLMVTFFIGARYIATSVPNYKLKDQELISLKISSGLYEFDANNVLNETVVVIDNASENTAEAKKNKGRSAIEKFMSFAEEKLSAEDYKFISDDYRSFRLSNDMKIDGVNMFIESGSDVIENSEVLSKASGNGSPIYTEFYNKCYKSYINNHAMSFLNTKIPGYFDLNKYMAFVLIFGETLPSIVLSLFCTYFVPCLIFKRGRCTFGKALYKIALLDKDYLSPTIARTFARFCLILLEFILAIPSFAATFIISFTMMLITKNKQGFPDYFLRLQEVNIGSDKIYLNFTELDLESVETHKEPIKFKTKNYD